MFLTDKHRPVLPVFLAPSQQLPALPSRLLSLLPLPQAPADHLSWLSRASHLLSLTLSDAASALLQLPSSPFLHSITLTLLHSCNSLSAFSQALLRRLLFLRFSLQSHKEVFPKKKPPLPELTALQLLSFMQQPPPPHGKIDSVENVICAVEAVSALVIGAIWVTLSGKGAEQLQALKVDARMFAWGKDYNKLLEAVSTRMREEGWNCIDAELVKMERMLGDGEMEKGRLEAMEVLCEEMREGLEKLNASMNALFQAALRARNAALHSLTIHAHQKC